MSRDDGKNRKDCRRQANSPNYETQMGSSAYSNGNNKDLLTQDSLGWGFMTLSYLNWGTCNFGLRSLDNIEGRNVR